MYFDIIRVPALICKAVCGIVGTGLIKETYFLIICGAWLSDVSVFHRNVLFNVFELFITIIINIITMVIA